jgi:hypothetical protein
MVLLSNQKRLQSAWRALAGEDPSSEGWRTIPIEAGTTCRLLAGRHFPGNMEALLVGFNSTHRLKSISFPQGRGFKIEEVVHRLPGKYDVWISLSRQIAGSVEIFTKMAEDIINLLQNFRQANDELLLRLFLGRIKAWQEFMEHGRSEILSPEKEVGLFGELSFLREILHAKVPETIALEAWRGPLDGLHDFFFVPGAVEVKSTIAERGFLAKIGSLEQLDEALVHPLFLVGFRLSLDKKGQTLPELISELHEHFIKDLIVRAKYENLVLHAGFLSSCSDSYERRFLQCRSSVWKIDTDFPKLTRGNTSLAIRRVRYEIDLDLVKCNDFGLENALKEMGVPF